MDFNELIVRFFEVLSRRKALFFVLFFVIFCGALAGAYVKPQKFESQAKLLVTLQAPRVNSSNSEVSQISAVVQPEEIMAEQVELMQTRALVEELVDELPEWVFVSEPSDKWYIRQIADQFKKAAQTGKDWLVKARLIERKNERYERIRMIEKGLTIFPVRKAHVIEIVFRSKNPEVPAVVISKLIELYQERVDDLRATSQGIAIYMERARQLSQEVAIAEKERAAFMLEHNISDFGAERTQLLARIKVRRLLADEKRLNELIELEPEYNLLARNVIILTETHSVYKKAAADRQAFFNRDADILSQIIDPPSVIYKPLKPSRLTLILLGLGMSLALSILAVLVAEWVKQLRVIRSGVDKFESKRNHLKAAE